MPQTINNIQIMRSTEICSANRIIPASAAPIVPIPVQTAYAVPSGSVFKVIPQRTKLPIIVISVNIAGNNLVNPQEYFIPTDQHISKSPAKINISQFIETSPCILLLRSRLQTWNPRPSLKCANNIHLKIYFSRQIQISPSKSKKLLFFLFSPWNNEKKMVH